MEIMEKLIGIEDSIDAFEDRHKKLMYGALIFACAVLVYQFYNTSRDLISTPTDMLAFAFALFILFGIPIILATLVYRWLKARHLKNKILGKDLW